MTAATHELPGTDAEREQLLAEIREANLTYLMLAQRLIRADKAEACFRLGLSEEAAELIAALSTAQVVKLASQNTLLARFQADDDMVFALLAGSHAPQRSVGEAAQRLHGSILLASRLAEAA
ncbi:MAG: flagellar transcriptional regulator FlhD [Tepidimonas ignava]|uniref:Flagellar transcriptional regulator FlhD n=1 Tax=Tepidimonas ignava TaxID=114249 RepID=A0A4R3LDG5_9BURK|nr:flagellar transcriptional regulator FlhD [Tepidimonas ignava]MCX7815475.1 flagellar transcriptional regulator FlhD [Tepidimonas ignava]TCS98023.1 flagellar transcriptional activator FlhD [Tepidimonas ignava]TSE22530.1 Flagellar transcriptional regulator FlhD [Tepidimonas ignava]